MASPYRQARSSPVKWTRPDPPGLETQRDGGHEFTTSSADVFFETEKAREQSAPCFSGLGRTKFFIGWSSRIRVNVRPEELSVDEFHRVYNQFR